MAETTSPTVRTFIAVPLPPELHPLLSDTISRLTSTVPDGAVRWVRAENMHLTLKFLGNTPVYELPAIENNLRAAVERLTSFSLRLGDFGWFPNNRSPRTLWMGVNDSQNGLADLHSRIERALATWGSADVRQFHSHLTLGRVKTDRPAELKAVTEAVLNARTLQTPGWDVHSVHLMQSVLSREGSRYLTIGKVMLRASIETFR